MLGFAYPGGKGRLARTLVSLLPRDGRIYVEPFAGRGALFFAAVEQGLAFTEWHLNDPQTASFLQALATHGDRVTVPPRSRTEFEKQRARFLENDPAAILLAPHLAFSGSLYETGRKGGTGMGKIAGGVSVDRYRQTLRTCHGIMLRIGPRITACDWRQLPWQDYNEEDVVVLDPPYLNSVVTTYSHENVGYEELVDRLLSARFRWLMCGYPHPRLARLGPPVWAKETPMLCVRKPSGTESRLECVWSNFRSRNAVVRRALPKPVQREIRTLENVALLTFQQLDAEVDAGLARVARDWSALAPYLLEMHARLSAPGRRTDLRKDAPQELTWTKWVESKRDRLGRSLRSVQYLLRGQTRSSRDRQQLLQHRAKLRSEPDELLLGDPLQVSREICHLILEPPDGNRQTGSVRRRRLELLARHLLEITATSARTAVDPIDPH